MPDYFVTMSERLAKLLERWTHAEVKPAPDIMKELEANKTALERSAEAWRKKGML